MLIYLFLLLVVLPLIEILILVKIGLATSIWVPIAIVLVTGIVGSVLARREGWKVWNRIHEEMSAGRVPADAAVDAFLVLLAGILFVLPGVLTDVVAIVLLFPPSRSLVKRSLHAWFKRNVELHMQRIGGVYGPNRAADPKHEKIVDARVLGTRVEDAKRTR
jgi:UPF0716 protein FxsA